MRLSDQVVVNTVMLMVADDQHGLTDQRMKRIGDHGFECQKPGTMKPARMEDGPTDYHGTPQSRLIEVEVHSINDLLQREPVWDLVHVDIQGGEGALCRAGIEAMNQRVRRVVIGTHSRALDGEVMSVFHAADWVLENEKPTIMVWREGAPTLETMARVDGVQVWRNPRLVGAPAT